MGSFLSRDQPARVVIAVAIDAKRAEFGNYLAVDGSVQAELQPSAAGAAEAGLRIRKSHRLTRLIKRSCGGDAVRQDSFDEIAIGVIAGGEFARRGIFEFG